MLVLGATAGALVYWYANLPAEEKPTANLESMLAEYLHIPFTNRNNEARRPANHTPNQNPPGGEITLTDTQGRSLQCHIEAKISRIILIRRSVDQQVFRLSLDQLDPASKVLLADIADFNQDQLRAEVMPQALAGIPVRIVTIPHTEQIGTINLTKQRYDRIIQEMKTGLEEAGVSYRIEDLVGERAKSNDLVWDVKYSMPPGAKDLPCMVAGDQVFMNTNNPDAIRAALADAYLKWNTE